MLEWEYSLMETIEIVRVKFLWPGRMYEFVNTQQLVLKRGDKVVCETDSGGSIVGTVGIPGRLRRRQKEDADLTPVLRLASDQDISFENVGDEFRREVKQFFETRLRARQSAGVKLVDVEKADGGRRLIIYYACENKRFDPRELSMELGYKFNMRIDMRSVGIRDAARLSGGIGKCGLSLCCSTWLPDFEQVSIRMAKDQGLSLDPEGINGQCGRLLCCLGYEHQNYVEMGKGLPRVGKTVVTPIGDGKVVKLDILKSIVTVRNAEGEYGSFPSSDVRRKFGPGGQAAPDDAPEEDNTPEPVAPED